jgi:hypothetical protein
MFAPPHQEFNACIHEYYHVHQMMCVDHTCFSGFALLSAVEQWLPKHNEEE